MAVHPTGLLSLGKWWVCVSCLAEIEMRLQEAAVVSDLVTSVWPVLTEELLSQATVRSWAGTQMNWTFYKELSSGWGHRNQDWNTNLCSRIYV